MKNAGNIKFGTMVVLLVLLLPVFSYAGIYKMALWPNGIVPYAFEPNVPLVNRTHAVEAMAEWEVVSNVDFVERSTQTDYVHLQNAPRSYSQVGRVGGKQIIGLNRWDNRWKIVHELGHSLGLYHEHQSPLRNIYVTILEERCLNLVNDFNIPADASIYGPYDFASVMHYNQCGGSTCASCINDLENCRTIIVNPPWDTEWQHKLGHAYTLTDMDKETMLYLYHNPQWIFVDKAFLGSPELGTFNNPYKTLSDGVSVVPQGGTIMVFPGTYDEANTYTKPMKLRSHLGGVVLQ
jgi:hypothetical protein